jgi:hypothetical protein
MIVTELADDPELSGWTELTEIERTSLRVGGIANKTEVGIGSGFDWYDDAGNRTLPGRRPIRVIETATSPDTTLFYGRVSTKGLGRGVLVTDDSKQFGVSLDDRNADLRGIVVDGWVRGAETDVVRVKALIRAYLSGTGSLSSRARASTDLADTYVAASPTVSLPAQTYTDTSPAGVLSDICAATGKECFVTVDGELFYDVPTSTAYASTYSITDDFPNTTDELLPIWDGDAATEDPSELLSGARAKYGTGGGVVSDSRSAVEDAFDKWEDTVFLQTTSAAKAALELDTLLDNQGIEEKSRRCAVMVPVDQVDRIKWGQTISFRAAASGDLTPVTLRISYLLWEVPVVPEAPYIAHLELSKPKKVVPRIKKGTNPGTIPGSQSGDPWNGGCSVLSLGTYTGTLGISDFSGLPVWRQGYAAPWRTPVAPGLTDQSVAASNGMATLTRVLVDPSTVSNPVAWIILDLSTRPLELYYETRVSTPFPTDDPEGSIGSMLTLMDADHATSGNEVNILIEWVPATQTLEYHVDDTLPFNIPYTDDLTALYGVTEGAWIAVRVRWDGGTMRVNVWPVGFSEPAGWMHDIYDGENAFGDGTYLELAAPGNTDPDFPDMFAQFQKIAFSGNDDLNCQVIAIGQLFPWIVVGEGDGVTDEFTFPRPYLSGSLEVLVDGIWQDVGEDDPTTGAFSLGFIPEVGEEVRVRAKAA